MVAVLQHAMLAFPTDGFINNISGGTVPKNIRNDASMSNSSPWPLACV